MYKQASLILTEGCNFNCPFCFEGTHAELQDHKMTDEIFEKIVYRLLEEGIHKVVLFGGEPTTNLTPRMRELLYEHREDFFVSIYTNGALLNDELIDWFKSLSRFKINISCHNRLSLVGAEKVAKKCAPHEYALFVVCDHNTFAQKFGEVRPLIEKYDAKFALQTIIPDFDFSPKYTLPIYETLVPYKNNIQESDLYNEEMGFIEDGSDQTTELIFTYDGKISLTASVNVGPEVTTYPLETPFSEVINSEDNPNNVKIEHYPWQCQTCPIKNYTNANCPYTWQCCHDFSLCRRQILLYAIIKEEKELLCDEIMANEPLPTSYDQYNNLVQSIMLNVTDQCNFRCRMCFCNWEEHYMTPEVADKAIALALERKSPRVEKLTINFFGGEPLMNFNLVKYVIEKWNDKCNFSMTTNGSLLTDEILDYLSEHKVGILFSIDGDKETQDYNRPFKSGQGSTFDVLKDKIPKILERYPMVTFRSTLIPATIHNLHHNYTFAKQQGFRNYFCTPDAYSDWTGYENVLKQQVGLITIDIIRDIYEGNIPLLPKFFTDGIVDYLRIKDGITQPSVSPYRCGMGIYGFGVGATGIISACQEHSTITDKEDDIFIIGDVENGISQEKHWKLIDKFYREKTQWLSKECPDCFLREVCVNHVCPSRQGFMFGTFAKHAQADCLWTQCSHLAASLTFDFFSKNFSPNFERFLEEILKTHNMELKKEVQYEV